MCKICVADGRMTQAELDEHNRNQTDGADGAAAALLKDDDGATEFLKALLGASIDTGPDLETMAQAALDRAVNTAMAFVDQENQTHGVPESAVDLVEACERDAGKLMYRLEPKTIALTLIVLARRYAATRATDPEHRTGMYL
jgi:hypothetical protein